jgi:hypothetical protein
MSSCQHCGRHRDKLFQHQCIHHTHAMHANNRSSLTTQVHTSGCKVHLLGKTRYTVQCVCMSSCQQCGRHWYKLFQHPCIHHTHAMQAHNRSTLTTQGHTSGCKGHLLVKSDPQCSVYVCLLVSSAVGTGTSCSSINVCVIQMLCMLVAAPL